MTTIGKFCSPLPLLGSVFPILGVLVQSQATDIDFNRDIRPILSENCFYCHGQDANKREGKLRLDVRKAAIAHDAFVPGEAEKSEIIYRVETDDEDDLMPPPDSNRILTTEEKELLRRWVDEGAQYQDHWAFVAPEKSEPPCVEDQQWPQNPIDHFVLAKLEGLGVSPSPEANRETLIKRLSIDLIGLPPTPAEVDAFLNDQSPEAYEKLVDRLLASPHYGERMALPWLDAARYADSNGFQQDGDTWQWLWRDWVVQALNDDIPFDQFTIWQLAGDLLPNATNEQKVATGFNRNHLNNGEGGAIPEEQRFVILFDRMETTATTWLGLTATCAQCHDHKYDPLTMKDYYSMMDAFNRVPESGRPGRQSSRIRVANPFIELPTKENKERIAAFEAEIKGLQKAADKEYNKYYAGWKAGICADGNASDTKDLPGNLKTLLAKAEGKRTDKEKKELENGIRKHFNDKVRNAFKSKIPEAGQLEKKQKELASYKGDKIPRAMVMSDDKPRQTHILNRGAYLQPRDPVTFDTPAFLPPLPQGAPKNRLGLAKWLVSQDNPLTSRVHVNRAWQHFFGLGIVKTAEDFGVQSEYPLHKDLLDWLAVEFRENGWSQKKLHKLIVMSATYRQTSKMGEWHRQNDRENRYYARATRFRMPAMLLRDWALASSGILNREVGGEPVYPYQPDNVWENLAITKERDFTYPASKGNDLYRRSLYTFWRRTIGPVNMFDSSDRQACRVKQSVNNTPLHALTTLNGPTWVEAARILAQDCIERHKGDLHQQLTNAFTRIACRQPSAANLALLKEASEVQLAHFQKSPADAKKLLQTGQSPRNEKLDAPTHAALSTICLAILNLDESMTRE